MWFLFQPIADRPLGPCEFVEDSEAASGTGGEVSAESAGKAGMRFGKRTIALFLLAAISAGCDLRAQHNYAFRGWVPWKIDLVVEVEPSAIGKNTGIQVRVYDSRSHRSGGNVSGVTRKTIEDSLSRLQFRPVAEAGEEDVELEVNIARLKWIKHRKHAETTMLVLAKKRADVIARRYRAMGGIENLPFSMFSFAPQEAALNRAVSAAITKLLSDRELLDFLVSGGGAEPKKAVDSS